MSHEPKSTGSRPAAKGHFFWLPAFMVLGVFLAGFVAIRLKSSRLNGKLFRTERQPRLDQIQNSFADAALDARSRGIRTGPSGNGGCFHPDRGVGSALPVGASEQLKPLLAQCDDLITLLAGVIRRQQGDWQRLMSISENHRPVKRYSRDVDSDKSSANYAKPHTRRRSAGQN